jgi:hypothetical protein
VHAFCLANSRVIPSGANIAGEPTGGARHQRHRHPQPERAGGGEILIEFDVTLLASLDNGTVVTNQSALRLSDGSTFTLSDDPNVNGTADPEVLGDEDPTRVTIASSAFFRVQKISTDLTGDPAILLAGETLRYTITVKNIGTKMP